MSEASDEQQGGFDPNVDRYPQLRGVLLALPEQEDFPEGPIERVEVYCHASGEATARVWQPRAEEPWGVMIPGDQLTPAQS